jgi:hypothetical protein
MGEHAEFVLNVQEKADDWFLLGRDTVEFGRNISTFQTTPLPASHVALPT